MSIKGKHAWLTGLGFLSVSAAIQALIPTWYHKRLDRKVLSMAYAVVGFYFSSVTPSATGGQPMITSFYQLAILVTGLVAYLCFDQWISGMQNHQKEVTNHGSGLHFLKMILNNSAELT